MPHKIQYSGEVPIRPADVATSFSEFDDDEQARALDLVGLDFEAWGSLRRGQQIDGIAQALMKDGSSLRGAAFVKDLARAIESQEQPGT